MKTKKELRSLIKKYEMLFTNFKQKKVEYLIQPFS